MPLLKVTGVPIAPAGKTLESATLTVRFLETYADGVYAYPRLHEAVLSFNHTRWEDLNHERFKLPGSVLYSLLAPPCILVERQIYTDGGGQTFQRGPLRIVETSPGEWHYGTPEPDALIVTTADAPVPAALLANQLGQPGGPVALDADGRLNVSLIKGLEELLAGGESGFTDFYYLQNGTRIYVANYATVPSNRKLLHGYKNAKILVDNTTYYGDTGADVGFGINEVSESSRGEGVHHVKVMSLADPDDFIEATFNFVLEAGKAPSAEPENDAPSYDIGRYSGARQIDNSRQQISSTSQLEAAFNSGGGRYYLRGGTYTPSQKLQTSGSALDIEGYPGEDHTISGENLPTGSDLIFFRNTDGNRLAHLKILFSPRKSIDIYESNNNVVEHCIIAFGQWDGVNVNECDGNVIRYNIVREMEDADEGRGISVHSRGNDSTTHIANNNEVYGNIVLDCERYGVDTEKSVNSEVYDNVVARCFSARAGFPYIESDSDRNQVSKNSANHWHHNIIIGAGPGRAVATSGGGGGQTWDENIIADIDDAGELGSGAIFHTFEDLDQEPDDLANNSVTGNIFIGDGDVNIRRADETVNNRYSLPADHLNVLKTIAQEVDELEIYDLQATLLYETFGGKAALTSQGGGDESVNATYADTRTEADVDPSYAQVSTVSELEAAADQGGNYYVRDGVYRLNQALRCDGKRLNLEGYPGETAIIDGSNMYEYDNQSQNSLDPDLNDDSGGYASSDLIHIRNASGSRLAYLTFTESPNRNVNFLRCDGFVVEHCVISYGGREGIWAAECDGGRVEFNHVYSHADFHEQGENGDCIKLFSKYNGDGDCRNIIIRNNWMHDASDDVVDMWTALDCLVENNVLHTGAAQHHIDPEELTELGWIIKGGSGQYPEGTGNSGNKIRRNVLFSGGVGGAQNNGAGGLKFTENIIEQHYVNNGNNSGLRSQPPGYSTHVNCTIENNYVFGDAEQRYRLNGRTTVVGDKNEELPAAAKAIYDDLKALCLSGSATLAQVLSKRDELMSELY